MWPEEGAHVVRATPSLQLAQRFEGCTHFRHEERRLFPGREVRAFGKLIVVDELHIRFLCPALWSLVDLVRKRTYADRKLDAPHVEKAACRQIMAGVPVETRGRDRGVGQPVE